MRAVRRGGARLLPGSATALLAVALISAPASAQFAVYPIVVTMNPDGDAEVVQSVYVRNEAANAREFSFQVQDFDQDSAGTPRFSALGTHARSCADRVDVYPEAATIGAGETQELRVRVKRGGGVCWAAVFAEAKAVQGKGIVARQQIGVRVNVIPQGTRLEGEVARAEVLSAGGRVLHVWFHNPGIAPVRPAGHVELQDDRGAVAGTIAIEPFSVLPGNTRRIAVPLEQALPAGRYTAVPVLDFGGDYLAGAQAAFVVR